jgi:tRNA nucleotidyltransferase (CCA-adding enzyme)
MQVFLVGGAVRDELLGLIVKDRDWVVVGSSPEEMIEQGFTPVGKDFPVFLHPHTREEYALARTERKSAPGYHGFTFHASPEVTLEEDLARRDLTINAMAKSLEGELIDPFGGKNDLQAKVFRHVSPAFKEDPVRVLRLARFAARFADFTIADETLLLAQSMAQNGEIKALVPERVWAELAKALMHEQPSQFFKVLMACNAFKILFPHLFALQDDQELLKTFFHHLDASLSQTLQLESRFALLFYPLPHYFWSKTDVKSMSEALKAPASCKEMANLVFELSIETLQHDTLHATQALEILERLDGFRRPQRIQEAIAAALLAAQQASLPQHAGTLARLMEALECTLKVDTKSITALALQKGQRGPELGESIHQSRLLALKSEWESQ